MKTKVIIICGPTATGKSDYAVALAKNINGEIISADSRQVYKGLDIGSGKITKKEMKRVPHYLLDVADPKRIFSAGKYTRLGKQAIKKIIQKGKIPIICGGTGFYIDALLGLELPKVKPNTILRKKLEKNSTDELYRMILKKDPERGESIDQHNKVRLIRALEIIDALGKVPKLKTNTVYSVEWIGLSLPDEVLKQRIHVRLLKRMKQGMVAEVKKLHTKGVSWKRLESLGLEYRYIAFYLQKKLPKQEMLIQLERAIWQYAKRQKTWFKKNKEIIWVPPKI